MLFHLRIGLVLGILTRLLVWGREESQLYPYFPIVDLGINNSPNDFGFANDSILNLKSHTDKGLVQVISGLLSFK